MDRRLIVSIFVLLIVGILQKVNAHDWVHMTPDLKIPASSVIGGSKSDGSITYVGRAVHEDITFPARVDSNELCAYISWAGSEIKKTEFEILVGENYGFVNNFKNGIPFSAVRAGNTADGEPLYVGRGIVNGTKVIGKIHTVHQAFFAPWNGKEHRLDLGYEVLIQEPSQTHKWVKAKWHNVPLDAVVGGHDTPHNDNNLIFVGRAYHEGELLPAKIIPDANVTYISYNGMDILKKDFEFLVGDGYIWVEGLKSINNIPFGAVSTGQTRNGDRVYVGRGHHLDSLTPGKVYPGIDSVYIAFEGGEPQISEYEMLVKI